MKIQTTINHGAILACVLMLSACSMFGGQPTAATPDVSKTVDAARTDTAKIVMTDNAAQASPTPLPPTATLAPSATTLPSDTPIPSATALPQVTATRTLIPYTSAPQYTVTPKNIACSVTSSSPDGATMAPRNDFDGHWVVKNTGTETWTTADYDYKFVSGQKMQTKGDTFNLKSEVVSGNSTDIIVDMLAPDKAGNFTATWAIVKGSTTVCTMTINLTVK